MSRKPSAPTTTLGSGSQDEFCPVCKTVRYLNQNMEFLINPVCYHPMCSNCVVRIFGDGPNQCPYAGCRETLRKPGFRKPFFADLTTEREVDIRRRVAAVFNRVEDDFETLRDYNDYLQMVEDLTFDLVYSEDEGKRRAAEEELRRWEAEHRAEIERRKKDGREKDDAARRKVAAERETARQRRLAAAREVEDERVERERSRMMAIDELAGTATGTAKVQLKRRGQTGRPKGAGETTATTQATATATEADEVTGAAGRLSIRGLKEKKKVALDEKGPYDPYAGFDYHPDRYRLRDPFVSDWLADTARKTGVIAGGYDVKEFYARSMFEAFSGLGVFINDEKETGGLDMSAAEVAELGASMAVESRGGIKMEVDDVFAA
ncbi:CDK-activating kinase assembly factor MAT1-domain-containing protein [Coniochaeta sp. 2T2.1]|nr:CDK-activating kinase assembly factor MAT1-domain-containing protein [Coniochaeta sp. 2T2.1]